MKKTIDDIYISAKVYPMIRSEGHLHMATHLNAVGAETNLVPPDTLSPPTPPSETTAGTIAFISHFSHQCNTKSLHQGHLG